MGDIAHPLWVLPPAFVLLTGCWMRAEKQMMEREETMGGHLLALFEAADAVADPDPSAFRAAMKQLEKGGELPGVLEDGSLDALHAAAGALKHAEDPSARATGLVDLASRCAACHRAHGVTTPALFDPASPREDALGAVVWSDEARWERAWARLDPAESPPGWDERRAALLPVLTRP
ncbi:MAG: hypothetical protein R3F61_06595 [Myxococcota bacterium]